MTVKLGAREARMVELLSDYQKLTLPANLEIRYEGQGIGIDKEGDKLILSLKNDRFFPRALSLIQVLDDFDLPYYEEAKCPDLGFMPDLARNGVAKPETLKRLLTQLALMGYQSVQLYLEDILEVPGYPYMGYLRGRYTAEDLKALDDFAYDLGIELFASVQTLAHLDRFLRWSHMHEIRDIDGILLVKEPKTYEYLDAMLTQVSEIFRSRRVNLGMDEAHMLGLGRYLINNGYEDPTQLMLDHVLRVYDLVKAHDMEPMIWSDMFFRLATGGQYDSENISEEHFAEVRKVLPEDLQLIYWNYYSSKEKIYDEMLEAHLLMTPNIGFAGGAWKWTGYNPANAYSFFVADLAFSACQKHNIPYIVVTAWGDNGAEASFFSILPALQYWAELNYGHIKPDDAWLEQRFYTCTNASWKHFLALDEPVFTPGNPSPGKIGVNPPKLLLYQDILAGLVDYHFDGDAMAEHFSLMTRELDDLIQNDIPEDSWYRPILEANLALCRALAIKTRAGQDLRKAYKADDKDTLKRYKDHALPELIKYLEAFVTAYHKQWLAENKAFGLDQFDIKLGGVIQRVKTAIAYLDAYLKGEITEIAELGESLLPFDNRDFDAPHAVFDVEHAFWHNVVSPGLIDMI